MTDKQRVFIYDRKEMGVLTLLGIMVAVFAFTLGVHLGKRVGNKTVAVGPSAPVTNLVDTNADKVPDGKDLSEESKNVQQAADDAASQALHDEVEKMGAKLDTPRQVELPKAPRKANAGATTPTARVAPPATQGARPVAKSAPESEETAPEEAAPKKAASAGKPYFSLQIGSYPERDEATARAQKLAVKGLSTLIKEAEIQGKGKWYRVFLGEYPSKNEAARAGQRYQSQKVIESYIVAKVKP